MVNQQLLDYIKQQVAAGTSKDVIQQALVGQGWNAADVSEAFTALTPAPVAPPAAPAPAAPAMQQAPVAAPVTIQPNPATTAPMQAAPVSQPAAKSSSHLMTWILILVLLAALAGGGVFAAPMIGDFINKTFYPAATVPMPEETDQSASSELEATSTSNPVTDATPAVNPAEDANPFTTQSNNNGYENPFQ